MKTLKTLQTIALVLCITTTQFAMAQYNTPTYSDTVTDNPTADADLKTMTEYTYALRDNDMKKAGQLLADNFTGYGPSAKQSQTKKETITEWTKVHQVRTNQKVQFIMTTFQVLEGDLKGNWVSQWGMYSFTENGKTIEMPYQQTARITKGKIEEIHVYYDNLAIARAMGYELTTKKQN